MTEQGSDFAGELKILLDAYLAKSLRTTHPDPFDIRFYSNLIPYSMMAKELINKFIDTPALAFDEYGEVNPEWDNVPYHVIK